MRLRDPKAGTVVGLGDADQIASYQARGWVDADKPAPEVAESPAPKRRGRPPKTN